MKTVSADKLQKKLYIGVNSPSGFTKDYSLLRSNGVAEKVFSDKFPNKPYSWIANVCTIAIDNIGGVKIGSQARQDYISTNGFSVPSAILDVTMADSNSLMMDIHRTVWKNLLKKQEIICKHCGSLITIDIDLDRIVMTEEDQKLLDSRTDWSTVEVNLPAGYDFVSPSVAGDATKRPYADLEGHTFNHMIFRTPTLRDAIKNEKYYADTITFWRRIAYDCLQTFDEIDENGRPTGFEMPTALLSQLGMKLFDSILFSEDLDAIRKGIRDEVPTLPFWYDEECPTCRQSTPVAMETTDFFSA